jgi:NAD-dependent SIR2 family protein deacetylase
LSYSQIFGDAGLPQRVTCSECNNVLYEGDILKSPQDIIKKYDGKCPKCNRKLNFSTGGVTIYPGEEENKK